MRKSVIVGLLCLAMVVAPTQKSHAVVWVVVKAAIKAVVKAIDLQIQRQQNKVIWLQNAQKTLENTLSKLKLREIGDWADKQKKIYQDYFQELNKVKTLISYYQRVRDITRKQAALVQEYKRAWALIRQDRNFTAEELDYIRRVYEGMLAETVKHLDELSLVVQSFSTSMSDAKRLEIIAAVDEKVDRNLADLRRFSSQNTMLSLKRAKSQQEIDMVRKLYGLPEKSGGAK